MPVGNAAGNLVTSWLNPESVLTGVLAVAFSGYLAAVFVAADSGRYAEPGLAAAFRRRALAAGAASGALAVAGLLVLRRSGLDLTHGAALVLVCLSAVGGLATLALCWRSAFALARVTAALAVAAARSSWSRPSRCCSPCSCAAASTRPSPTRQEKPRLRWGRPGEDWRLGKQRCPGRLLRPPGECAPGAPRRPQGSWRVRDYSSSRMRPGRFCPAWRASSCAAWRRSP